MITNIEELMSTLRLRLGDYLQRHGIEDASKHFTCIHPDHADKTPSMSLHRGGTYIKCFSCDRSADIFAASSAHVYAHMCAHMRAHMRAHLCTCCVRTCDAPRPSALGGTSRR